MTHLLPLWITRDWIGDIYLTFETTTRTLIFHNYDVDPKKNQNIFHGSSHSIQEEKITSQLPKCDNSVSKAGLEKCSSRETLWNSKRNLSLYTAAFEDASPWTGSLPVYLGQKNEIINTQLLPKRREGNSYHKPRTSALFCSDCWEIVRQIINEVVNVMSFSVSIQLDFFKEQNPQKLDLSLVMPKIWSCLLFVKEN